MKYHLASLALISLLCITACRKTPSTEPPALTFSVPENFQAAGTVDVPDHWWTLFADQQLDQLIETCLRENHDLKAAWYRLDAANAVLQGTSANRAPTLRGSAGASRGTQQLGDQPTPTDNAYTLGLEATYEVDLWQKLKAREQAASLDAAALAEDLQALAMVLSSTVANIYYSILEQQGQLALLDRQIEVSRQFLEIIEARFTNGAASAVEVFQQREQLASLNAQKPGVTLRLRLLHHQLAVLLGQAPGSLELETAKELPAIEALPALGLPMTLLQQRPDVRAAFKRIQAQDARLAAAISDRYPSLRLSASTNRFTNDFSALFQNWLWSIAGSITGPILDFGRLKAEVARNRAVADQRVVAYEQAMLDALRDVEDALVRETYQRELIARQQEELTLARSAYDAGRARYLQGVGNFLTVLTELQAVQRVERNLLAARAELVASRVSLHGALGGTYTQELKHPGPSAAEARK